MPRPMTPSATATVAASSHWRRGRLVRVGNKHLAPGASKLRGGSGSGAATLVTCRWLWRASDPQKIPGSGFSVGLAESVRDFVSIRGRNSRLGSGRGVESKASKLQAGASVECWQCNHRVWASFPQSCARVSQRVIIYIMINMLWLICTRSIFAAMVVTEFPHAD